MDRKSPTEIKIEALEEIYKSLARATAILEDAHTDAEFVYGRDSQITRKIEKLWDSVDTEKLNARRRYRDAK